MTSMLQPKQFSKAIFSLKGISKTTVENHLKLYEGYVKKYNEIMEKLKGVDFSSANQTYSDLRSLKIELSFAIGGVKNHEIYFEHLGGKGGEPRGVMREIITRHFGSYQKWVEDFKASGLAARGWVWLAYDWRWGTWFNYLGDAQNTFPVWECSVAVALDTYEHAYWADFGPNRAAYIDAFLKNLNWDVVEENVKSWNLPK
jgi:Fe-Mn family superoxide dismutase